MILACVGSSPAIPANFFDLLAQSAEHLTFNQGVPRSSRGWVTIFNLIRAGVAELADALDLGSSVARRGGSSPFSRTNSIIY